MSHSRVPVLSVTNTAPLRQTSCFCSRPPARVKFPGVGGATGSSLPSWELRFPFAGSPSLSSRGHFLCAPPS